MYEVALALIFCVLIPSVVMTMLEPSLSAYAPSVKNFRGVTVYNGLGIAWFIWVAFLWVAAELLPAIGFAVPTWMYHLQTALPLIAGSCAFGLFDDCAGDSSSKGFKGHLRALSKGVLTTGGLKLVGIGFLSLSTAFSLFYVDAISLFRVFLALCTMALFANLMNLFDLRPGRASKVYIISLVVAILCMILFETINLGVWGTVAISLAAVGPVLATWRFDIGEHGMLGDAGANSMGALVGYFLAISLPVAGLAVVTVLLFVLNLKSERISFSKVIAETPFLAAIDTWGRSDESVPKSNSDC